MNLEIIFKPACVHTHPTKAFDNYLYYFICVGVSKILLWYNQGKNCYFGIQPSFDNFLIHEKIAHEMKQTVCGLKNILKIVNSVISNYFYDVTYYIVG